MTEKQLLKSLIRFFKPTILINAVKITKGERNMPECQKRLGYALEYGTDAMERRNEYD